MGANLVGQRSEWAEWAVGAYLGDPSAFLRGRPRSPTSPHRARSVPPRSCPVRGLSSSSSGLLGLVFVGDVAMGVGRWDPGCRYRGARWGSAFEVGRVSWGGRTCVLLGLFVAVVHIGELPPPFPSSLRGCWVQSTPRSPRSSYWWGLLTCDVAGVRRARGRSGQGGVCRRCR